MANLVVACKLCFQFVTRSLAGSRMSSDSDDGTPVLPFGQLIERGRREDVSAVRSALNCIQAG